MCDVFGECEANSLTAAVFFLSEWLSAVLTSGGRR